MNRIVVFALIISTLAGLVLAQTPATQEQAKTMANQTNKPILLEFFQPDCEFCQLAARDLASNDSILTLLKSVVYLSLDVNSTEGERLSKLYYVDITFPVFILTDSTGSIINHWTGYSMPEPFIQSLNDALFNQITIAKRYENMKNAPSLDNVLFLAKYNTEIGDNIKAGEMYQEAQALQKGSTYIYDIFQSTADAVWKGKAPFEQLLSAADDVLIAKPGDVTAVSSVGIIVARVARRVGRTSDIDKYLQAGVAISTGGLNNRINDWHLTLLADQTLYAKHDTDKAISLKKESLGPDWETKPIKFYNFAKWCLERKINLDEAELYANKAVEGSTEGKFRASILVTLANVYEARGKMAKAILTMQLAVDQDPHNTWYQSELKRLQDISNNK
jgi:tetratricopeptide (TPR) repeat protein